MPFHIGQEVICVDASGSGTPPHLVEGAKYTISRIGFCKGNVLVDVAEAIPMPVAGTNPSWFPHRFRPIQRRQTDISVFHAILRKHKAPEHA